MQRKWTEGQRNAHEILQSYGEHQKDMQYYKLRIEQLETDYMRINQRLDGDMVKTWDEASGEYVMVFQGDIQRSSAPDRATTKMASYLDHKTELEQRYKQAEESCMNLEWLLAQRMRGYPSELRCLNFYYLFRLPLDEVADVMNCSLSKVKTLRKDGLAIFSDRMYQEKPDKARKYEAKYQAQTDFNPFNPI